MTERFAALCVFLLSTQSGCERERPEVSNTGTRSERLQPGLPQIRTALLEHLPHLATDETARLLWGLVDLNGDGQEEAIVHLLSSGHCGSGGCTTLVLEWDDSGHARVLLEEGTSDPPIFVTEKVSFGYRQIHLAESGRRFTIVDYDGRHYRASSTPSQRLPVGAVVIGEYQSWSEGTLLHPVDARETAP